MELKDTTKYMVSCDYKERFIGEYLQLKIRMNKLLETIVKYEAGTLDFIPETPIILLIKQYSFMNCYAHILEDRARIEGIEIECKEATNGFICSRYIRRL